MERIRVVSLDLLADGAAARCHAAGHPIALFRLGSEVFALGDRCSHAEASLSEGEVSGGVVECPRHGATFDLRTGEALSLPATHPVPVYRTEVEGSDVYVYAAPVPEGAR